MAGKQKHEQHSAAAAAARQQLLTLGLVVQGEPLQHVAHVLAVVPRVGALVGAQHQLELVVPQELLRAARYDTSIAESEVAWRELRTQLLQAPSPDFTPALQLGTQRPPAHLGDIWAEGHADAARLVLLEPRLRDGVGP